MESSATTDTAPAKKSRKFIALILGLVGLGLLTLICLGVGFYLFFDRVEQNVQTMTQAVSNLADQPVLNQIAFVGNDRNLWLVSPNGEGLHSITTDGQGYHFPTWAPDGQRLAFVGPNEKDETVLYVAPTSQGAPVIFYDKAESAPFYLYWSPDSHTITFLTQEPTDLNMRQIDVNTPGSDRVLGVGAPFYWVWSPTSDKLLMHVGGSRALSEEAHLSLLDNRVDAERVELNLAPGKFQAPFWSADGKYFYYIAADDKGQEAIYKTNANTLEQAIVTKLQNFSYLTLSPDGKYIGYVQIESNNRPPFGTAYIIATDGKNKRQLLDNPVGSMYWSPDGTKLALLSIARRDDGSTAKAGGLAAPLPQEIVFRWLVYYVDTEEIEILISFTPTVEFLETVPFFDQYHLSLTFWSPDSRYFVVTKEENNKNGEGTVWVADTNGQEETLKVGEGTLAVWSWK
jgi:Tol biopolymer transport system component